MNDKPNSLGTSLGTSLGHSLRRTGPWTGEVLVGERLLAYAGSDVLARFVLARAGLQLVQRSRQTWHLHGRTLEVSVHRDARDYWLLQTDAYPTDLPLAVVYAAAVSGELREIDGRKRGRFLNTGSYLCWKRRAILEAGLVGTPDAGLASLPDDATEPAALLWNALELLVRVRMLGGYPVRKPFLATRRFMCSWTPSTERVTRSGMEWLEREGLILRAGTEPSSALHLRPATLWTARLREGRP